MPAGGQSDVALITPDGQTVLAAETGPSHDFGRLSGWHDAGFAEISAATGARRLVRDWKRTSGQQNGGPTDVLWTSRTGRVLVVYSPPGYWNRIGVLRGNRLTLLPQPPRAQVPAAAW